MSKPNSQSSEKPSALEALQKFLLENEIQITTLPLKTWTDTVGHFVIDPPQVSVTYKEEEKEEKK